MDSDKDVFGGFLQSKFGLTGQEWREKICRHLGFIVKGVMRYTRFEESGEETTCYFASENDFVGDPVSFESEEE